MNINYIINSIRIYDFDYKSDNKKIQNRGTMLQVQTPDDYVYGKQAWVYKEAVWGQDRL